MNERDMMYSQMLMALKMMMADHNITGYMGKDQKLQINALIEKAEKAAHSGSTYPDPKSEYQRKLDHFQEQIRREEERFWREQQKLLKPTNWRSLLP